MSTKILFIDTGLLTKIFGQDNLEFNWQSPDLEIYGKSRYAYVRDAGNPQKRNFIKFIENQGFIVNAPAVSMSEFLLQTHIRAIEAISDQFSYIIVGNERHLIDVLHPLLDIRNNDTMNFHHAHEMDEVIPWIDASPNNVFWHDARICLRNLFTEKR